MLEVEYRGDIQGVAFEQDEIPEYAKWLGMDPEEDKDLFYIAKEGLKAPGTTVRADQTLCDVGPLVSRKAQFVPAFSHVLAEGFSCHRTRVTDPQYAQGKSGEALDKVLEPAGVRSSFKSPGASSGRSDAAAAGTPEVAP